MTRNFLFITSQIIEDIIDNNYHEVFNVIKNTYLLHEQQKTINPKSYFLRFKDNDKARIIALPAAICDDKKISGIKWIASYPDNLSKYNLPRASAVIILNCYETGIPLACLEGSIISAARTTISAIVASQYIDNEKTTIENFGIIGNGYISKSMLKSLNKLKWDIENIYLYDINKKTSISLRNYINDNFDANVQIMDSYQEVIKSSSVIMLSTTASIPYVNDISLFKHNPLVLHLSLRDLSPEILYHSHNIVDDIDHILGELTSPHLTFNRYRTKNFINGTIGQVISGQIKLSRAKPIIFSPMGMGILDIALARYIYQKATDYKNISIPDFFPR